MKHLFFVTVVVLIIYFPWFNLNKTLSSGDWPYLYPETIDSFSVFTRTPFLWLDPYHQLTAKLGVQIFSLSWELTERIFWFFPFLSISMISSYLFLKYLSNQFGIDGNKSTIFIPLGCLIFTTNTYIIMLVGGGQMGVAMAYSLVPAVILILFKIIQNSSARQNQGRAQGLFIRSIILAAQLMFDPRIFLLSVLIAFFYILLFKLKDFNLILKKLVLILTLSVILNSFWISPNSGYFSSAYESAKEAANASFLSFATFSNSISLLHPNWPENIFGKIYFMRPEFLILPILAYSSLLFISNVKSKKTEGNLARQQLNSRTILFFALLGLSGSFLAKGTNPPFGELYEMLSNMPGFSVFRDPTKFYALIVLSYMVLIPFSVYSIQEWFKSKVQIKYQIFNFSYVFLIFTFLYLLFFIKPAVLGQLAGTFKPHVVPKEYVNLKDFLSAQPELAKTLWVPQVERFGFSSTTKPAISAMEIFGAGSISGVLKNFDKQEARKQLIDEKIKYVVIPYDFLSEIFVTDRKYDEKLYGLTVNKLKNISWLSEIGNSGFGKIKVFEIVD